MSKVTKITKVQKLFLVGAVALGAFGIFASKAKAADLLYVPKAPHVGYVDDSGWYLAGRGGAVFGDDFSGVSFDTGYNFSGALGYDWGQVGFAKLRTEAEVGYFNQDGQIPAPFSGSVDAIYGLLNAYADFDTGTPFTPFIGVGGGYANVTADVNAPGFALQSRDKDFAWDATAGVSYNISKNVTFDVAYRYLAIPDVTFNTPLGSVTDDVNSHEVTAGVRVRLL